MPTADHEKTFAGKGTHVGNAVGNKFAVSTFAESRNAGIAQRVRRAKRAGTIEDQVGGLEAFVAVMANEQAKRHLRAFGIPNSFVLPCRVTSDCHHLSVQLNWRSQMRCERGEIAIGEFCSGELFLPIG